MDSRYRIRVAAPPKPEVVVPFLDLEPSHAPLRGALLAEIGDLLQGGAFTNGPKVRAFEEAFAEYCGADECVGVANGLDALRLSLIALGLEPGDEVVIPALTFVATAEAITQAGGTPVLADVNADDCNLDPKAAEAAIGPRTRAVLPVHLYGQMADMSAFTELSSRHGLALVEDAAQAHGASRDGHRAGTTGIAAGFSFYPAKNLGALGDAGAVVTSSADLAVSIRALREHGQRSKYRHDMVGWTSRLDTLHAAVLLQKLPHLDQWNEERRAAAAFYLERLNGVGDLVLPSVAPASEPVWHLFVVRTANPDGLSAFLRDHGVGSGRHYPEPIHLTGAYRQLGYAEGRFPVAERVARECLSLAIFPGVSGAQLAATVDTIHAYFERG